MHGGAQMAVLNERVIDATDGDRLSGGLHTFVFTHSRLLLKRGKTRHE